VTEVLSGDYYQQLSTSSPHQIWSAAMVVSPILRGMLGLKQDAVSRLLTFRPEVPANWTFFRVRNVRVGAASLDLTYRKTLDGIALEVERTGPGDCELEFSPALSLRAEVLGAELNGHKIETLTGASGYDQHVTARVPVEQGRTLIHIRTRNDFGVSSAAVMPMLGAPSQGLRITSEVWSANRDSLELGVSGIAGKAYDLAVWNVVQITSLAGAEVVNSAIRIKIPGQPSSSAPYSHNQVTFHFAAKK
jgi:hypothetical protein